MGIPTSGRLYLCNSSFMGVCRSIAHAVYGTPVGSVNLCSAGVTAGFSTPIKHSCFYGYDSPNNTISVVQYFSSGGADGEPDVCRRLCFEFDPPLTTGSVTLNYSVCLINSTSNSLIGTNYSCYVVCYNQFSSDSLLNTNRNGTCSITDSISFSTSLNKGVICVRACSNCGSVGNAATACSVINIDSISTDTSGNNYIIGTPMSNGAYAVSS